jgi:hypothetical protein
MTDPDRTVAEPEAPAAPPPPPGDDAGTPPSGRSTLPPDPAAYDHPRAEIARAKGLDQAYIPGGHDPDPETAAREERRLLRWLLAMVVIVILAGFVLGIVALVVANLG